MSTRGVKPENHFGYYALYVSFFPQLVAGPIERSDHLIPQLKSNHVFEYNSVTYGFKLMAWGFFKKIVVADTLARYVDKVFSNITAYHGLALIFAVVTFTLQIYADFSGYSDIAIGASKMLGIELMTNFKSPYFSRSIKEFWKRWHISLSTWFRDYVYIPLGGSRKGNIRKSVNLMVTFLLSGLWHGASWTFVVWGGLHGCAQIVENLLVHLYKRLDIKIRTGKLLSGFIRLIHTAITFMFVSFAWLFFRAETFEDAWYVINHMFINIYNLPLYYTGAVTELMIPYDELRFALIPILTMAVFDYINRKCDVIQTISNQKIIIRWFCYVIFVVFGYMLSSYGNVSEFIYFQF